MVNWNNISPTEFEELCYYLIELNNFTNIQWFGKGGGDRGRDILCEEILNPLKNITISNKWLIQCKRYTTKKITKTDISDALNSAREHNIDCFLLAITDTLSSDLKDWINSIQIDYKFKIVLWEDLDIKREITRNLSIIASHFPDLVKSNEVVEFYEVSESGKTYYCNEFDEVGIHIMNDYGEEKNIEWINEFIQFIKANDIKFLKKGES